jgi:pSer/pThr/pTyr-binding forkhead associated (FHA) protein
LISFPDGVERDLQLAQFIVDGTVVAEQMEPPFDRFEWNLADYVETEDHALSIKVVDLFGFETRSIPQTVTVQVQPPPRGLAALRPALGSVIAVVAVLILGVSLAVFLLSQDRRTQREVTRREVLPRLNPIQRPTLMTQAGKETEAFLVPLHPSGDPIPLVGVDVILGRDASLSAIVLEDPSVEGMHARLIRQARGTYLLRDQGSIAGTWVNFERTFETGRQLHHGDRIHIGRVQLRFELPESSSDSPVRISSARPIIPPVDPTIESG